MGSDKVILYLHGLNSAGSSGKATVFRSGMEPVDVLSPTYPAHRPALAVRYLSGVFERLLPLQEPLLLVGSSMGGFYGQHLARHFPLDHLVMINPALRPWDLLPQVAGWQYNEALDERYILSAQDIESTRQFALEGVDDGIATTLLLDKGDELIDYRIAESIYAGIGRVELFDGGSHAFEYMDEAVKIVAGIYERLR
ncbi:MAG: hypothetical protein JMN27_00940 [gamma proteobacterium endosymbiont of Lamellibrachia anaximandri]|nr:hypothetical protein [gamma proteobacterium endosymbiont of Lamellibrachia anaximandri]MBL3532381.1 hypothetical protein [gamma proteobacterium endosymbiont of Lamellibrachia anaximandri]